VSRQYLLVGLVVLGAVAGWLLSGTAKAAAAGAGDPLDRATTRALLVFCASLAAAAVGAVVVRVVSDPVGSVLPSNLAVGEVIVALGAGWGALVRGALIVFRRPKK
jgi:hypothetical protein